ncbi:MAG: hypothetical protein LUE93_01750 [Bacteroides sp.]|nr:hypothetical protein [Bacteroides sp.]
MTYFLDEKFKGTSCKAELYLLGLYTCNLAYDTTQVKNYLSNDGEYIGNWPVWLSTHYNPLMFLQSYDISTLFTDEHNTLIEKRLKDDYTKYMNKVYPYSSEWAPVPIDQEYRITEIANVTITCNQPLFGKIAGSSLNDHFHIYKLDPGCIFAGNNQLKVTYEAMAEKRKDGLTIDEWLNFRPLSAACFYFTFNSLPAELPVNNLRFSISMETLDGVKINCTRKEITLTL